jgi:hypothetical protein
MHFMRSSLSGTVLLRMRKIFRSAEGVVHFFGRNFSDGYEQVLFEYYVLLSG